VTTDEIRALREMEKAATPDWKQALHIDEPRALVSAANPMVSLLGLDRDDMAIFDRAEDCAVAVALRNSAPALLDAAERCARYEAALHEEKTVAIGLAHTLIMSLGEQVAELIKQGVETRSPFRGRAR
jgi:hypothetical protein